MIDHFEIRLEGSGTLLYGSDEFPWLKADDRFVYTNISDVTTTYKVERVDMHVTETNEEFISGGPQVVTAPAQFILYVSVVP